MFKSIYLVNCDTELYSSETRVLGVYLTIEEAIARVQREYGVGKLQSGCFGSFWQNKQAGLRYYLRSFPLGDQRGGHHAPWQGRHYFIKKLAIVFWTFFFGRPKSFLLPLIFFW